MPEVYGEPACDACEPWFSPSGSKSKKLAWPIFPPLIGYPLVNGDMNEIEIVMKCNEWIITEYSWVAMNAYEGTMVWYTWVICHCLCTAKSFNHRFLNGAIWGIIYNKLLNDRRYWWWKPTICWIQRSMDQQAGRVLHQEWNDNSERHT